MGNPIPVISGNVSFYNESALGKAIPPSPVVALAGRVPDLTKVRGMELKEAGNPVYLLGERLEEMGASAYHRVIYKSSGGALPEPGYGRLRRECLALIVSVQAGRVRAAHDIGEGGLATAAAEMILGRRGPGSRGLVLSLDGGLSPEVQLFSETGGFLVEVAAESAADFEEELARLELPVLRIGEVIAEARLSLSVAGEKRVELPASELSTAWRGTLPALFTAGEEVARV